MTTTRPYKTTGQGRGRRCNSKGSGTAMNSTNNVQILEKYIAEVLNPRPTMDPLATICESEDCNLSEIREVYFNQRCRRGRQKYAKTHTCCGNSVRAKSSATNDENIIPVEICASRQKRKRKTGSHTETTHTQKEIEVCRLSDNTPQFTQLAPFHASSMMSVPQRMKSCDTGNRFIIPQKPTVSPDSGIPHRVLQDTTNLIKFPIIVRISSDQICSKEKKKVWTIVPKERVQICVKNETPVKNLSAQVKPRVPEATVTSKSLPPSGSSLLNTTKKTTPPDAPKITNVEKAPIKSDDVNNSASFDRSDIFSGNYFKGERCLGYDSSHFSCLLDEIDYVHSLYLEDSLQDLQQCDYIGEEECDKTVNVNVPEYNPECLELKDMTIPLNQELVYANIEGEEGEETVQLAPYFNFDYCQVEVDTATVEEKPVNIPMEASVPWDMDIDNYALHCVDHDLVTLPVLDSNIVQEQVPAELHLFGTGKRMLEEDEDNDDAEILMPLVNPMQLMPLLASRYASTRKRRSYRRTKGRKDNTKTTFI